MGQWSNTSEESLDSGKHNAGKGREDPQSPEVRRAPQWKTPGDPAARHNGRPRGDPWGTPGDPAECEKRRERLGVMTLDQRECSDKSDGTGSHDPSDSPISVDTEEGAWRWRGTRGRGIRGGSWRTGTKEQGLNTVWPEERWSVLAQNRPMAQVYSRIISLPQKLKNGRFEKVLAIEF
ncbi:unnamed protein product [Arctogadus glacialis]